MPSPLPDDFAVFILTHGRPDRCITVESLRKAGYTGRWYLVVDDEDPTVPRYREKFGDERVLQFCKVELAARFDEADNFGDRRTITHARNACFDLAAQVGVRTFIQLDDDYSGFYYRFNSRGVYDNWGVHSTMDDLLAALVEYYLSIPAATIAMSQGGDHIGGARTEIRASRKAMNSFICSVDRRFAFLGRMNEDVNTYTFGSRVGRLFLTIHAVQLNQLATQSNPGGMSQMYRDHGTYVKAFYTVMHTPSGVKISELGDPRSPHRRIHHAIRWNNVAPMILRESCRKPR